MADADGAEGDQGPAVPEEDLDDMQKAMLYFGKYSEARRALPWDQWSFREKANYFLDRLFLGFLALAVIVLLGEFAYKMWYVTNVKKIAAFVSDSATFLYDWISNQEAKEELLEL